MASLAETSRVLGGLAVAFQEPLTIILRVCASANENFRHAFLGTLQKSQHEAEERGYGEDKIADAKFVVVVFLDEAISESKNPLFTDWEQLQFELYRRSDGGEVFFEQLRTLLKHGNTSDAADLLEVYGLCLLLGFEGGETQQSIKDLSAKILAQIVKIRDLIPHNPSWSLPVEPPPLPRTDTWLRWLIGAVVSLLICLGLLTTFKWWLNSGAQEFRIKQVQSTR